MNNVNYIEIMRDLAVVWVPAGIFAIWGIWDQAREEKRVRRAKVRAIKRRHAKRVAKEFKEGASDKI